MFWLGRFGEVELPLLEARQTISSGESLSAFRQLPSGGAFRVRGTERSPRQTARITATGEYVEDAPINIEQLAYDLYAKRGELDKLYRHTRGTEQVHWCWAELLRISADNTPDTFLMQPVGPEFQMISPCWYGSHHGGETWTLNGDVDLDTGRVLDEAAGDVFTLLSSETSADLEVDNNGNFPIDNAIITISAHASQPIATGIEIIVGLEAHLIFNAEIPAGQHLVIDCGARGVTLNGTDAYDDFEVGPTHKLGGWLRLHPGTTTVTIDYVTAANATITFDFSDGHE